MRHAFAPVIAAMLTPMPLMADTPFVHDNAVPKNTDPKAAELVFSDITLFWKAYDSAKPENRVEILREEYLKKGSAGLKEFTRKRIGSAENLAAEIAKRPKYYASLREPSGRVGRYEDAIRASFRKLKELYEPAVFPKVYFLIGAMNSGGTVTNTGLLIGVDMYGITKTTPMEELGAWHRTVLKPIDRIPHIVAHELIHYQQKYPKGNATLLQMAIMEGSADFLAELISGSHINGHLHEYGNPRKRELWAEFSQEMDGKNLNNWLFQGDGAKKRPADLGYYIGYKICESYYKQAANKKEAIRDILEIKDFKAFLKVSKYESKFVPAPSDEPGPARHGPLAALPSRPGPHIEKIKTLGDNAWLRLSSPAPDPKWGTARGRSWSSNMPLAPDIRGMFVFAEGVHAYVKPDGHYMNDLWFYDINGHRWICLYPGIEVKTITQDIKSKKLTVDEHGLMVDKDGQPLPPLLIHAYGYLGYDPDQKKFATFGGQFANYFTTGKNGVFEEANRLFQEQRKDKKLPSLSPFFYDVATGRFECHPVELAPKGQPFGANILVYIQSKKQFWYGGSDGAWYLDRSKKTWVDAKPKGTPPTGIDHCAAYDAGRDRIYYHTHDGKKPEDNFFIYDVKSNTWSQPRPKGPAPLAATSYESIYNFDAVNDRLVIIRLYNKDQDGLRRGVYAYNPDTNSWGEPLPIPAEIVKEIRNGNYGCHDPELNAYFCHFASDSTDNGVMWAYRYKNPKK